MSAAVLDWKFYVGRNLRRLPPGARRLCQRGCGRSFKAARGRRFCAGCSKNDHTRRRWLKAGCREIY